MGSKCNGSNLQGEGDIRNCSCYRAVNVSMSMVEMVLVKGLCGIVFVDEIQFVFMPERGTNDAVFILRMLLG